MKLYILYFVHSQLANGIKINGIKWDAKPKAIVGDGTICLL